MPALPAAPVLPPDRQGSRALTLPDLPAYGPPTGIVTDVNALQRAEHYALLAEMLLEDTKGAGAYHSSCAAACAELSQAWAAIATAARTGSPRTNGLGVS